MKNVANTAAEFTEENPRGYNVNDRLNEGWQHVITEILNDASATGYQRAIIWLPSGRYMNPSFNMPSQFMDFLPHLEEDADAFTLFDQNGIDHGFWWGRAGEVPDPIYPYWDLEHQPTSKHPADYYDSNDMAFKRGQLEKALERGAHAIGLDAVGEMAANHRWLWFNELREVAPDVTFIHEGSGPDFLHSKIGNWYKPDRWRRPTQLGPDVLVKYLGNEQSEIWVLLNRTERTRENVQELISWGFTPIAGFRRIDPDVNLYNLDYTIVACHDNIDNDGDGFVDWPYDRECESAADNTENGEGQDVVWPPIGLSKQKSWAYAWQSVTEFNYNNIVDLVTVTNLEHPEWVIDEVNNQPEGHHALLVRAYSYNDELAWNPLDCIEHTGYGVEQNGCAGYLDIDNQWNPFKSIWRENGVLDVTRKFTQFFNYFYNNNAQVDLVVLDTEEGLGRWNIATDPNNPDHVAHWNAIEHDARFDFEIRQQLDALGFLPPGTASLVNTVLNYYQNAIPPQAYYNVLVWNALMAERVANYVDQSTCAVVSQFYPSVTCSDYNNYYWSQQYPVPERNGHIQRFGTGRHVGTHQTQQVYASINGVRNSDMDGDGIRDSWFRPTPYNAFRLKLNAVRALMKSSNVPFQPWVAPRSWSGDAAFTYQIKNTDLWQELILHLKMLGAKEVLYWNARESSDGSDAQYLSATLKEFDDMANFDQTTFNGVDKFIWDDEHLWHQDYTYTSVDVANRQLMRFTPLLTSEDTNADEAIEIINSDKIVYLVGDLMTSRVVVEDAQIVTRANPVSQQGHWLLRPIDATEPYTVSVCGNGLVEEYEQCDDGGRCMGDDTTFCTSHVDCDGIGSEDEQYCMPRDDDGCTAQCRLS